MVENENIVKVRKSNVVLEVKESEVDRLVDLGYDVIDDKGNVVKECIPTDIITLQKHYVDSKAEIERLKQEIATLKKKATKSVESKKSTNG